ncbi:MAG: DUF883 C-terminal domain-containing protein [Pseudomonadales bacterium]|jgi:ElaB/YqjD/DUF883 family membrane-anchored ribosome-binding protein|nr:DUF883 C-terminal domain-containing protein [Pseudomonadales bacterium]
MSSKTQQDDSKTNQVPLTDKARDTAHEVVDKVALSAAQIEKNARQGSKMTEQKVTEMAKNAQEKGQVYLGKTTSYVQENPLKALGIAAVSGYLISKLVSSKK